MREILFKGKTPFTGTIGSDKWIESKSIRIQGNYVYLFIENKWVKVNTDTLVQYTGLKDKNGNKIFEGDIINGSNDKIWSVFYLEKFASFRFNAGRGNIMDFLDFTLSDITIEVVGNIYDNPELLKGE